MMRRLYTGVHVSRVRALPYLLGELRARRRLLGLMRDVPQEVLPAALPDDAC